MMNLFWQCLAVSWVIPLLTASASSAAGTTERIAQPRQQVVLSGRLEELAGAGCTLPVELTIRNLQRENAKLAPVPKLQGIIEGYPEYLLGKWGGDLVVSFDTDKPGASTLKVGDACTTLFFFERGSQGIYLHPTTLVFAPQSRRLGNTKITGLDKLKKDYQASGKTLTASDTITTETVVSLGSLEFKALDGESCRYQALSNTLRELKRGVVEQDVIQSQLDTGQNGKPSLTYQEYVCRFTWYRTDLVLAQIGTAHYDRDRQPINRRIYQGWISSNWKEAAIKLNQVFGDSPTRIKEETGVDVGDLQTSGK